MIEASSRVGSHIARAPPKSAQEKLGSIHASTDAPSAPTPPPAAGETGARAARRGKAATPPNF